MGEPPGLWRWFLHGLRVAFSFTLDDHGVLGVNNVVLRRLRHDGRRLSDCRRRRRIVYLLVYSFTSARPNGNACVTDAGELGTKWCGEGYGLTLQWDVQGPYAVPC